jgi:hypothetical protein
MPRSALGSLPVISQEIVVGEDSDSCSKVTVPVTFESPRTTATRRRKAKSARIWRRQNNRLDERVSLREVLVRKKLRL